MVQATLTPTAGQFDRPETLDDYAAAAKRIAGLDIARIPAESAATAVP